MNKKYIVGGVLVIACTLAASTLIVFQEKTILATSSQEESLHTGAQNLTCPYMFVSWNLGNFGKSKTDETIEFMAKLLAHADIIAAQEVTAGKNVGAQAVARLAAALSRTGSDWDYVVSDPTRPLSPGVERYAYLFKKKSISFNRDTAKLLTSLENEIDREPFTVHVVPKKSDPISLYSLHALPSAKSPEKEVAALLKSDELRGTPRAIFAGDFNLSKSSTDPSFKELGFTGYITELTSLKMKVSGDKYLLKQYDNIYTKGVDVCSFGVIDFVAKSFTPVNDESLYLARKVSDHLPVFVTFK